MEAEWEEELAVELEEELASPKVAQVSGIQFQWWSSSIAAEPWTRRFPKLLRRRCNRSWSQSTATATKATTEADSEGSMS